MSAKQNFVIMIYLIHATCPVHLINLDLNTVNHASEIVQILRSLLMYFLQSFVMLYLMGPDFLSTLNLCYILYSGEPVRHKRE
jgi:hypothetical protein